MKAKFQNIQPKVDGLRCEIQVLNHQGHGILTTFAPEVENSVELATKELNDFWGSCVDEYPGKNETVKKPHTWGRKVGESELNPIDIKAPDFDLGLFEQVTILPTPMAGG